MRVCGDYRMANAQLQKSFPTTANGTDELAKLPGYSFYGWADRFSMYNAYALEPGPSRELLAIHTPLGLIEPTRMVFGEMNAGTVACAATPAILCTLPDNAYLRLHRTLTITLKAPTLSLTFSRVTPTSSPCVKIGL